MTEVLGLECKPFNIKVMLVSAGSVQSNIIGKHDDFQLAPGSLYSGFFHNIRARLEAARDKEAMKASVFAEDVISKVDSPNPPSYLLTGGKVGTYKLMGYLPRSWILAIVWNMFSKPEEKPKGECSAWMYVQTSELYGRSIRVRSPYVVHSPRLVFWILSSYSAFLSNTLGRWDSSLSFSSMPNSFL